MTRSVVSLFSVKVCVTLLAGASVALAAQPKEKTMPSPFVDLRMYPLWEVPMQKVVSATPGPLTITEMFRAATEADARKEARRRRPGYAPHAGIFKIDNGGR